MEIAASPCPGLAQRNSASQPDSHGCWRTLVGAEAFLAVRSYLSTARKQGLNPLAVLRQLFQGHPWLPAPTRG